MRKTAEAGFTLIEMMVVVEIIAIMCAVMLPAYLRSRIETNEAATVSNLRTVISAQISYNAANLTYGSLADLATETAGGRGTSFLETSWAADPVQKAGYRFTMDLFTDDQFSVTAAPVRPGTTGIRTWHGDEAGRIWFEKPTT